MKKIIKLTESDLTKIVKRVIEEQSFDPKKDYLSKGYIDVTDGFVKDTYALQIPDGTYKCDGAGYSFKILSNDGKDTGYVVIINSGIRGMITGPVKVSDNGVKVSLGQWNQYFNSLLYNEKLNQLKKVVKEQMDGIDEFEQILQDVGEPLSNEEIQELQPNCPISSEVPEHADELRKFEEEVKGMSISEIKNKIKELKAIQRSNKVQEQNYAGDVMGMKVVKGLAGLMILVLIIELFRRIFRGGTRTNKACRQRNRLVRRYGIRGATM